MLEAEDDDLLSLLAIFGELATLFNDRDWSGVCGNELDRRNPFLAFDLIESLDDACRRIEHVVEVLIASLSDLRVAFMTSVASMDLSLADNCSLQGVSSSMAVLLFALPVVGITGVFFKNAVGLMVFFGAEISSSAFGISKLESKVVVVTVHADCDLIAARIESADSCGEAIIIQSAIEQVLSTIRHYTKAARQNIGSIWFL